MIKKLSDFAEKKVLILGYGMEGKSTEEYIRFTYPQMKIGTADQADGSNYLMEQEKYDFVIKTPGIPKKYVTKPYTTATNIFFEKIPKNQIIGVTGSKGKSTTASLIAYILKESGKDVRLIGNIGEPALKSLLTSYSSNTIFVYELSSYQLDDMHYSPHISVITSLFPEHIPYHGSVKKYYEAKHSILTCADSTDYYIYNNSYEILNRWGHDFLGNKIAVKGLTNHYETKLIGVHNFDNIELALAVSRLFDISENEYFQSVKSFQPLPHRLENIGTFHEITFFDDAISTTPESTIAALNAIENVETIFLGGEDRGYDFHQLGVELQKYHIQNIVLFPDTGAKIELIINELDDYHPQIFHTSEMKEAVAFAYKNTKNGTICLLSTASPSYSVWKNFIEKGTLFQTFVKQYAQENQNSKSSS